MRRRKNHKCWGWFREKKKIFETGWYNLYPFIWPSCSLTEELDQDEPGGGTGWGQGKENVLESGVTHQAVSWRLRCETRHGFFHSVVGFLTRRRGVGFWATRGKLCASERRTGPTQSTRGHSPSMFIKISMPPQDSWEGLGYVKGPGPRPWLCRQIAWGPSWAYFISHISFLWASVYPIRN